MELLLNTGQEATTLAPTHVSVIDTAQNYTDPQGGPADIADDLLPLTMDGLDRQALSEEQQAGFPDLWDKAGVKDSGYIITNKVLYSIWTPSTTSPEYPRIVLPPPNTRRRSLIEHMLR